MGIFSRLTDIINSNITALLDKAEDPEKIVRLIIQEMEDTLVEVRTSAARCIADKKELERRTRYVHDEYEDWGVKAELAVAKGRDDLAKSALLERAKARAQLAQVRKEGANLDELVAKYGEDIARLQAKLDEAKARQKALVQRHHSADSRLKVRRHIHDGRVDEAMMRFDGYERRIDDLEGLAQAEELGRSPSLGEAFAQLEQEETIKQELEALKARLKRGTPDGNS